MTYQGLDLRGVRQSVQVKGHLSVDQRQTLGDLKLVLVGLVKILARFRIQFAL